MPDTNREQIHIQVHRTPHATAEDFNFLHEMLRQPSVQIYAPESNQYDSYVKAGLEKITSGNTKVYRDVMDRTNPTSMPAAQFQALFALRKPLAFFDISQEDANQDPVLDTFGKYSFDLTRTNAEQMIAAAPRHLRRGAAYIAKRDTIIAHNIRDGLPELIQEHPRLRSMDKVGVLMTIGDTHQTIDRRLKDEGFSVETNPPTVFEARQQAICDYLHGREPSSGILIKAAAMMMLRNFVWHASTLELRSIMNDSLEEIKPQDIDTALTEYRRMGAVGVHGFLKELLQSRSLDGQGLEFIDPLNQRPAILPKQTPLIHNGIMGIRTGIF